MKIDIRWAGVACILATGLALGGCAGGTPAAPAPQAPSSTQSDTTASSAPPVTSSAPKPAPRTAADGTDYGVCARRSCEVAISAPVHIRFGGSAPGTLAVTKVAAGAISIDVTLADGGGGNGTLKPGCSTFVFQGSGGGSGTFGGGSGTLSGPGESCAAMPTAQPYAVTVQMPAMTNGVAMLRIVTG